MRITEQLVICKCGWQGMVIDCDCDADICPDDDDGRLRCPKCSEVVKEVNINGEKHGRIHQQHSESLPEDKGTVEEKTE
jgi:hypothetical protein